MAWYWRMFLKYFKARLRIMKKKIKVAGPILTMLNISFLLSFFPFSVNNTRVYSYTNVVWYAFTFLNRSLGSSARNLCSKPHRQKTITTQYYCYYFLQSQQTLLFLYSGIFHSDKSTRIQIIIFVNEHVRQ